MTLKKLTPKYSIRFATHRNVNSFAIGFKRLLFTNMSYAIFFVYIKIEIPNNCLQTRNFVYYLITRSFSILVQFNFVPGFTKQIEKYHRDTGIILK